MKRILKLMIIVLITASCSSKSDPIIQTPVDAKPVILSSTMAARVNQDNEFAFDLLKKTIALSGETNVFVSPLSVSIALGMAWNGANGTTKAEMETALKMNGMSVSDINDYYKIMQTSLPAIDPTTKLSIANSMWYKNGFEVKPGFLKINSDYFNAYIKELDFTKSWALDTINNWCSKKTNTLIPTIVDNIPSNAVMYLMNAVYFKGIWCKKFEKKNTAVLKFTTETGNQADVNMMYQKDTFKYAETQTAQYLDIPYGNKAFSMTVILPVQNKTTADVLNSLTAESWTNTLNLLNLREVMVYLPRFKVTNKFKLNDMLKGMGMQLAFTDFADFSNISDLPLQISEVIHKTYVTVDEEGTEAAAVTSIGIITTSMPQTPVFRVDKPFVFVIREKSTGVILFIGKMGSVEKY
jgi:serine protease inhibitor